MKKVLDNFHDQIHGIIHNSGGAQTKVLNFVNKLHVTKDNLFETPPLFKTIKEESGTTWQEMYQVYNMGHRMEIYCPESLGNDIISISKEFGVDAKVIGYCKKSNGKKVTIKSQHGTFDYE